MRRWLPAVLALVLVAVLVFLGYQAYTAYQGLQARVAALGPRSRARGGLEGPFRAGGPAGGGGLPHPRRASLPAPGP